MKKANMVNLILLLGICWIFPAKTYSQTTNLKPRAKMETNQTIENSDTMRRILIDKLIVPENAKQEFVERLNINRNFIKQLPGFIEDAVYDRVDEHRNLICVTVAVWENEDALKKAKEAVQAEYKRQNFDLAGMLKRLNITIDRGIYKRQ